MKSNTVATPAATVARYNRHSFQSLVRAIELSQGEFCLILARCNDARWREYLTQQLQKNCSVPIQRLTLSSSTSALDRAIEIEFATLRPKALAAFNLESVESLGRFLAATEANRAHLKQHLAAPLIIWVSDESLHKISRFAPALYSWASRTVSFMALTSDPELGNADDDSQSCVPTTM